MAEAGSGWSIRRRWWSCGGGTVRRRRRTVVVAVKWRMTLQSNGGGHGRGWGCLERHGRWTATELVSIGDRKRQRRRFTGRVGSGRREVVAGGRSDLTKGGSDEGGFTVGLSIGEERGDQRWVLRVESRRRRRWWGARVVKGVRRQWGLLRAAGSRGFGNAGQRGKKVGGVGFGAGGDGEAGEGRGDGMSSSGDGDVEEMGKIDPRGEARQ